MAPGTSWCRPLPGHDGGTGFQATLWLADLRASPDPGEALLDFLEAAWQVESVR